MLRQLLQVLFLLAVALAVACAGGSPGTIQPAATPIPGSLVGVPAENPALRILSPLPGGRFEGSFAVEISNFDYQPDLATNARTEFANGFQEAGRGHLHGWVFDSEGNQIRFYGAGGADYAGGIYTKPDEFEPGDYKVYFATQNHDHTPTVQAAAPLFPPISAVSFVVE